MNDDVDYNDQPSIIKQFWYFLTFKTYDDNLLTTNAASYLTGVCVIMSLVALTEAIAWGHFGTNLTPEQPLIGKVVVGLLAFFVIWYFDRMLVTQDLLAKEHSHTLEGEEKPASAWEKFKIGSYAIFVVRLGIVVASVWVTSGFITQLVFKADIEKEMQSQYKQNIETAKQTIIGKLDKKIQERESHLKSLHDKLQKEIGGKRGSGYGKGAVAKSIEQEILASENILNDIKTEKQTTEQAINQAIINNDEQTLKTFGIEVVKDSPIFRQQAVDKFSQDPAFKKMRRTVEVGLALISIILVLSKLFQTKNVQLYYSEKLQELWGNYKEGYYDDYLPNREKSINLSKKAQPQTFERIMINYAKNKDRYEQEEQEQKRKEQEEKQQILLEQQRQKEQAERLEKSHQEWAERIAEELQGLEYESKTKDYHQKRINDNKAAIKQRMALFEQENSVNIAKLKSDREAILTEIADATRIYESKKEDANARQERFDKAKHQLATLQAIAIDLEQKEGKSIESVRSYAYAQKAIAEQKQVIKNLQDNYLTFERDMNFYEQKLANLNEKKAEIEQELLSLRETYTTLKQAYHAQELAEIQLLGTIDLTTPYIRGSEAEIPHIAEKVKNNQSHYFYIKSSNAGNDNALDYQE